MSSWIVCGGLFIDAVAGIAAIPGISEGGLAGSWLLGALAAALPGGYKLLAGTFGMIFNQPVEVLHWLHLPGR